MEWIEPVDVKSAVKFSSSLVNSADEECRNIIHGSITESNLAWFACGDRLDVVSTTHSGVQSRHFQCPQGQEFEITCVASIPNENLALVGLSSNTGSGAVALYNYVTSMILNSWSVSHKVTCICSMEIPNVSYKQFLKSDCFLFALGTEEGHVMLLAVDQHFKFCAGTHQLDLNIVHYVTPDDILQKRVFFKPPVVLVIPLNDSMYRAGKFVLESMHESNAVLSVRQEEISATVVKYIPQNQTLCVGYNTQGAFQMFSLKSLELDFSGFAQGCNGEQLGRILDFVFLEPEDDPRHFCYLTVVAQKSCEAYAVPYALLYSLSYVIKEVVSEGRILYEDLQYITLRWDLNFGPLILPEDSDEENVELLTCKSLASSSSHGNPRATTGHGLCYFTMTWKSGVYLAIFDLNQWYQAQMPPRWIFDDSSRMCPFMGFYQAQTSASARSVRQVWIQPSTLSIFHRSSTTPTEGFFYPSALSFRAVVVCPQESEIVLFLGIQSFLLQKLSQAGAQVLNHPHRFYVQAMKAGLTPTETVAPHTTQMTEALLNIGLENNSRSFLVSCIKDEGANLNFVEKWAWQQVVNLKSLRENLCHILFDHSTQDIERQMHTQLYHVTHQFNNLAVLYDVMDKRIRALNSGVNDKLRDKSRAIYLLSLHLETVLWFLHGGLLPEVDEDSVEDEECTNSLPYPRRKLEHFYRSRKMEIESLSSSVKAAEVLLIEQLVPSSVVSLWAEERGTVNPQDIQTYPPPSLYALLSAYLRPDVDDVTKHRLVQYVFMDLTWIYGPRTNFGNILQHLVTFPSTYSLKPSMIKVTQAFWHLDHQNFDDALSMLLDPLVHTMDITNAQQRAILRSFLYQDKRRHALKYATLRQPVCPELEDIQLHLTILIANGLISDALSYIRRNRNQRNSVELMQHLLNGCQEMRKISVLLTLPLSDEEEDHVTNFLKQSRNIDLQEALLLFYIQRCKYPDAIAYSQRLNQMWPARDAISRERFNRREMLMQTLIGALPPITCKLAAIANSRPTSSSTSSGGSKFPRPLSVAVLPATSKIQSTGSNFFRTVIEQSRATWLIEQKLHQEVQTPLRPRKRKFDMPESGSYPDENQLETTPFLCNIVQPAQRNITLGMSLCFPSPKANADSSSMDITSVAQLDADISHPKQGKRPRFSLFPKAIAAVKTDAEVVSVLQTPPIRRSRAFHSSNSEVDGNNSSRPSSILKDKMRRFMNFSAFDAGGRPVSDADPSESETEMEISTASAKHLRFSLPQSQVIVSPPLALDMSEIPSAPEAVEDDMEVVMEEDVQGEVTNSNLQTEESQFLSFEEDSEPLPPQPSLPEVAQAEVPEEIVHPQEDAPAPVAVEEEDVVDDVVDDVNDVDYVDDGEHSDVGMELTNLEATSIQPAQLFTNLESHTVVMDDDFERVEATTLTTLDPIAVVEKEPASSLPIPTLQTRPQQQESSGSSNSDESEIVCLDSSSDEEAAGAEATGQVEGEDLDEEEEDYSEEIEEEEQEEEEEEDEGVEGAEREVGEAQDDEEVEEVQDDEEVEEEEVKDDEEVEEEEERDQEDEPIAIAERSIEEVDVQSDSDEQEVCEDVPNVPETRTEFISEPEEEESNTVPDAPEEDHQPEREATEADHKEDDLQEESFVPSIDSNEEDDVSEYSHSMEGSDEEQEPEVKKETLDDSSSSSEATGSSLKYSSAGQTTMSNTTYKKRFTMSSSSSSSSEEEEEEEEEKPTIESDEELRQQEMAALRKPVVSGYSQVEPDLECIIDEEEEAAVPFDQEPVKMEEEEEEEETQQDPAQISGYSQVEPDLEDIEVIEDEEEQPEAATVEQPTAEPSADLVDSPQSPVSEGAAATSSSEDDDSCVEVDSDDEKNEEEQEDEEEENFELHLAETPKSNVTRRSSRRRRFSMSSAEDSPAENETIHEEEESQHENQVIPEEEESLRENQVTPGEEENQQENQVIEPELTPTSDSQSGQLNPDEIAEQERQRQLRIQRSSVFKSRLHLTDSEASSSEEEEEEIQEQVHHAAETEKAPVVETEQTPAVEMEEEPIETPVEEETEEEVPESKVEPNESDEEQLEEGDIEAENSEESSRSEGSTTDENEELRDILQAHESVEIPYIPNTTIITTGLHLSTIDEERSLDQSMASALIKSGRSPTLDAVGEEEEAQEPQAETLEEAAEMNTEEPSGSNAHLDTLEVAKVEDGSLRTFEQLQPLSSEDEETAVPTLPKRGRGRPKSSKLGTQVLLPFTSRRSIWDNDNREDRDRSPESFTSEPPQTFEDILDATTKKRTRRHSSSVPSVSSQVVTRRRSTRLSTSISEAPPTPINEEAAFSTAMAALETTPQKSTNKRYSGLAEQSSAPPSCEVSPSDSTYSGRSSAPGTPMRRSARISALRDRTPEPTASTDALLAGLAGRVRRHSSGPGGPDVTTASPLRRSGRKSNVSRDNSPTDSSTSEPPPQSTSRELTPSRRKHTPAKGLLRSAQKSVALNLFPVEEEKETEFQQPEESEHKMQAGLSYQDLSVAPVDSDESISHDEMSLQSDSSSVKKQKKPRSRPSSVSSVSSGRYNLRRGASVRPSELDIISEEAAAAAAAESATSSNKRSREEGSEESSDQGEQAGPSQEEPVEEGEGDEGEESSQKAAQPKRVVRNKKRKTTNKQEEEDPEELRFAPTSRPPPKNLPKRDPVIKARTSSVRRSMRLDK